MGQINDVEAYLRSLDSSLESWYCYLTAACRYFTQKGLLSVLYRTQLLMNVSVHVHPSSQVFIYLCPVRLLLYVGPDQSRDDLHQVFHWFLWSFDHHL